MCKMYFLFTILVFQCVLFAKNGESYMVDNNPYRQREVLDQNGKYHLEWLTEWKHKRITFHVTVQTTGYVGFGLSDKGKMSGADVIIGGVIPGGKYYFADYHAVANQEPVRDHNQDWNLLSVNENGTHTLLSFSRAFDTCDSQDYPITEDKISIIWAFGERDEIRYHHGDRGVFDVYLLHPNYLPQIITDPKTGVRQVLDANGKTDPDVKVWTINRVLDVPNQKTMYWCTMHKSPRLKSKSHFIGFETRLHSEETLRHIHHLAVWKCTPPRGREASSIFDSHTNTEGVACLDMKHPTGTMPTEYCNEIYQAWAVGGRAVFHPPHVGVPFESEGYYVMQLHLDNPTLVQNTRVNISGGFFYTEKIRQNEGGLLLIGHAIPGLPPSLLIPPHTIDHKIRGLCGSQCTRVMLPTEGISVYGVLLHTHNAGRKMRIRHFRNNAELPFISEDENFSFSYQQQRNNRLETRVLQGDQLVLEGIYDSAGANGTIVGGYATHQEMLTGFLHYYQRLPDVTECTSEITTIDDRRYFLAGIENVTWSNNDIQFIVDKPHLLAGKTITQVSNNEVDWNLDNIEDLERYHLYRSHLNACPREIWATEPGSDENLLRNFPVAYPYEARPYLPEKPCDPLDVNYL